MTEGERPPASEEDPLERLVRRLQDPQQPATPGQDADEPAEASAPELGSGVPARLRRLGDYELLRQLGQGGMGTVYEARRRALGEKRVALKVLTPGFGIDPRRVARFRSEALIASRLSHPGIVAVLDIGEHEGTHYLVQELVEGGRTLETRIREQRDARDPARGDYRALAELFAKIADALQAIHSANLVHRDVKPSNILLTPLGEPKVADFGLAKDLEGPGLSATGESPGTPRYKGPEQVDARLGNVDARTDVFALGVTLYEALTFVPLFDGDSHQEIYRKIREQEAGDPRAVRAGVPEELALISGKALEKEPRRRYASMAELAADLRRFLANEPIVARRPSPLRRARLWVRRHPVAATTLAAALLLAGAGAVAIRVVQASAEHERLAGVRAGYLYVAGVGSAGQVLQDGEVDNARVILDRCEAGLRGWEWSLLDRQVNRLIAGRSIARLPSGVQTAAVSAGPAGRLFCAGAGGEIREWKGDPPEPAGFPLACGAKPDVFAADASGDHLAIGTREGRVVLVSHGKVTLDAKLHASPVYGASFAPDGLRLATCSADGTIAILETESGRELRRLDGLPNRAAGGAPQVFSIAFSHDGLLLASAANEPGVRLRDTTTWEERGLLPGLPNNPGASLCFTPGDEQLLVGTFAGELEIWDRERQELVVRRPAADSPVVALACEPGSGTIALGTLDGKVLLVERETLAARTHVVHPGRISSLGFLARSPTRLVASSRDGTVTVLSPEERSGHWEMSGHAATMTRLEFLPDGRLCSASIDETLRFWDLSLGTAERALRGLRTAAYAIAATPDGGRIWGGDSAGCLCAWSPAGELLVPPWNPGVPNIDLLVFAPDGRRLAAGYANGVTLVLDPEQRSVVTRLGENSGRRDVLACAFTGEGLVVVTDDGHVRLWNPETGQTIVDQPFPGRTTAPATTWFAAALSADASRVAWGSKAGEVWVVDRALGAASRMLRNHPAPVTALAFSPDDRLLASGDSAGGIWLCLASEAQFLCALGSHGQQVVDVCFDARGRTLASAGYDGWIRLWEADETEELRGARVRNRQLEEVLRPRVRALLDACLRAGEAQERLEAALLSAPELECTTRLLRVLGDDPRQLAHAAYRMCTRPGASREDYEHAWNAASYAMEPERKHPDYELALGAAALRTGRLEEALAILEKWSARADGWAIPANALRCLCLCALQRFDEARALAQRLDAPEFEQARDLHPEWPALREEVWRALQAAPQPR